MDSKKPEYFFQTERGEIISKFTHDVNNNISLSVGIIRRALEKEENIDIEKMRTIVRRLDNTLGDIDYLYSRLKILEGY